MIRTTSINLSRNFIYNFNQHLTKIAKYQDEVSSGKKLTKPSDNPGDAMLVLDIKSYMNKSEQYMRNIEDGQLRLNLAENSLMDVQNLITRVRDLAMQGNNSTTNQADRDAMAIEVNQLLEHLLTIANKKSTDGYIFGGTQTETEPFEAIRNDGGEIVSVSVHGDISGKLKRVVGPGEPVVVNTDGKGFFYGEGDLFDEIIGLRDALRSNDRETISDAIGNLNDLLDDVLGEISEIGSKSQYLEERKNELGLENFEYLQRLSDLEDADLTSSIIFLQQEQIAYQAALSVSAEILKTSIMNFIR